MEEKTKKEIEDKWYCRNCLWQGKTSEVKDTERGHRHCKTCGDECETTPMRAERLEEEAKARLEYAKHKKWETEPNQGIIEAFLVTEWEDKGGDMAVIDADTLHRYIIKEIVKHKGTQKLTLKLGTQSYIVLDGSIIKEMTEALRGP